MTENDTKIEINEDEIDENDLPACIIKPNFYDKEKDEDNRKLNMSTTASTDDKMLFYNAGTNNDKEKLLEGIRIGMSIAEECSAASYFWTCLHYACFYGHEQIIEYILDYDREDPEYLGKRNIQCNKGKTPVMYVLANCPGEEKKKKLLNLFLDKNAIDFGCCDYDGKNVFDYIQTNLPGYIKKFYKRIIEK